MRRFQFITLLILLVYSAGSYSAAQNLPDVVPPPSGNDQPVDVKIGLYLIHIVKIDQPNQILSGLFEITMLWKDDRLSFQSPDGSPKNYSGVDADKILAIIWAPDPEIVNQASKPSIQKNNLTIFPDGSVIHRYIFSADILTEFDYTRFPFDDQELRVEIQSFTYNSDQLVFTASEQYTGISKLFRSDDWLAYPASVFAGFERAFGYETQNRSYMLYEIKLERRSEFYVWQIILPFCFFILISTCVFWIHWVSIDRRVAIIATFMLTSVAYNFLVLKYLPSVPYKTMLNAIITAGYFVSGIYIVATITFELFKEAGRLRAWELGNIITRFLAPIFMIAIWLLIYYIFINKELQIIYLVK